MQMNANFQPENFQHQRAFYHFFNPIFAPSIMNARARKTIRKYPNLERHRKFLFRTFFSNFVLFVFFFFHFFPFLNFWFFDFFPHFLWFFGNILFNFLGIFFLIYFLLNLHLFLIPHFQNNTDSKHSSNVPKRRKAIPCDCWFAD